MQYVWVYVDAWHSGFSTILPYINEFLEARCWLVLFFFVDFLYVPFPDFWVHLCWFFSSSSFFCCYLVAHFIHSKYYSIETRMLGLKWLFVNKNFFFRNFSIGNNRATKFQRKRKYTQKIKSRNIERYKNGVFATNNVMLNWWIPTCLL